MTKETGETLRETPGNVKRNGGGKHKWNCRLWGLLRRLVTSFQATSYIDGTTYQCWGISIVFPTHFSLRSDQESHHEARWHRHCWMYMCLPGFILWYTWYTYIYLSLFSSKVFTSWLVGNLAYLKESKQNKFSKIFGWKEDKGWRRRRKSNSY